MGRRPSVCYAAPGHSLLSTSGTTRNILCLAYALSKWVDVTVAFRRILEPIDEKRFRVIQIEPNGVNFTEQKDDEATRGINPISHISYLRTLKSFAQRQDNAYDLVLEKGWRLSGFLLATFRHRGIPGILIENDVRYWNEPLRDFQMFVKYVLHNMAQFIASSYSRHVPVIVAETDELKTMLVKHRNISPNKIEVVGLGVDHSLFYPMDKKLAREFLHISPDATLLLYVGAMDKYHDLSPVIESIDKVKRPSLELHIVGDGEHLVRYKEKAKRTDSKVQFHGRVPHSMIPKYIAAADLCIAPYRVNAFYSELVTFSTLKIPEYMACGRPVVSVPSGHIKKLIDDCVSGFLFPNDVASWTSFFKAFPSREQLEEIGRAASQAVESLSWEKTAARYLELCQRLI